MHPKKPRDLIRIFTWSAVGMVAIDVMVDTGPVVCTIDPTCRTMSTDEIAMVRPIFGDTIDYESVHVFKRPALYKIFSKDSVAATLHSNIYLSRLMGTNRNDYGYAHYMPFGGLSKQEDMAGVFVHELTHVWQNHHLGSRYYIKDPDYEYELSENKNFTDYSREQQAEIVHDYFEMRRAFTFSAADKDDALRQSFCQKLAPYEEKLKPYLPVQPHELCRPDLP